MCACASGKCVQAGVYRGRVSLGGQATTPRDSAELRPPRPGGYPSRHPAAALKGMSARAHGADHIVFGRCMRASELAAQSAAEPRIQGLWTETRSCSSENSKKREARGSKRERDAGRVRGYTSSKPPTSSSRSNFGILRQRPSGHLPNSQASPFPLLKSDQTSLESRSCFTLSSYLDGHGDRAA